MTASRLRRQVRKFKTPGSPPQAQIIAPGRGDAVPAGQRTRLVAAAINDRDNGSKGRSLTWFTGRSARTSARR